ncbi:MAG: Bug family tripartite tricarboxylate transporter substrate binding protein [Beijerinckiaceae bacterium]
MGRQAIRAVAAAAFLAGTPGLAAAQSPAEFYKGKNVTIVVGFSPGGGYDIYARLLSRHIGRHIPGAPDIIVQNAPGAGSLTAVRQLDATLAKDGRYMTAFNPALLLESLVNPEKTKYDFNNLAWIGSMYPDVRVCYFWHTTGIKTWDDLVARKEINIGATGRGTGAYINAAILKNLFNLNMRIITGFPGGAEQVIAIERGELDADCGSWSSVSPEWLREGKVTPVVTFSPNKVAGLPENVRYLGDFAKTQEQKDILSLLTAGGELGRPYVMSQAVPADRVEAMRRAFDASMKDPALLAEAAKLNAPILPAPGERATEIIRKIYSAPPALVEKAKKIIE